MLKLYLPIDTFYVFCSYINNMLLKNDSDYIEFYNAENHSTGCVHFFSHSRLKLNCGLQNNKSGSTHDYLIYWVYRISFAFCYPTKLTLIAVFDNLFG